MVICVWKEPPKEKPAACSALFTTIQAGLDAAAAGTDKTVVVYAKCSAGRCSYDENVKFPAGGIELLGDGYPIINGMKAGRTVEFKVNAKERSSISGFEIIGGHTEEDGGGIYAENTPVTIVDNCIHNNVAERTGGGICIKNDSGKPEEVARNQCIVERNGIYSNGATYGGGIGARGDLPNSAWEITGIKPGVIIRQNVIGPENRAAGVDLSYGGGVSVYRLPVSIEGNEIFSNVAASYGGGVGAYNVEREEWKEEFWGAMKLEVTGTPGNLKLNQVILSNNRIRQNKAWKGGGVAGLWFSVITYNENIIEENTLNNSSDSHGGGIYGSTAGVHRLTKNLIQKNKAMSPPDGRGGAIHASCNAIISFEGDNIVTENEAEDYGGAISLDNADMYSGGGVLHIAKNKVVGAGGAAARIGGGIYACSSDSTDGGKNKRWQPCNHNNTLLLRGAIVEGNICPGHGLAIAVEKGFSGVHAVGGNVSIEECVIRNNKKPAGSSEDESGSSEGVYFTRGRDATSRDEFVVRKSLIEGHSSQSGWMAGIRILDHWGPSIIEENVIKENDTGLRLEFTVPSGGRVAVKGNSFERNGSTQIEIKLAELLPPKPEGILKKAPHFEIKKNSLDGKNRTVFGILLQSVGFASGDLRQHAASDELAINENDFTGYSGFGMHSPEIKVRAPQNYWRSADGPSRPDGKLAGERIDSNVDPDPFNPKPINKAASVPNLSPPSPPVFVPPKGPDCTDLSQKKRKRKPDEPPGILKVPTPGITEEPTPGGTLQPTEPTTTGQTTTPPQTPTPTPPITPPPTPGGTPTKPGKRPKRGKVLYVAGIVALIVLVVTGVALVEFPPVSPGNSSSSSSSSSSTLTGTPDFRLLSVVATLSPPNTYFVANVSVNGQHTLSYKWSNSNTCGVFGGSGETASWFHGDTTTCSHATPYHPGTITVTVTDETGFSLTCTDPNGSRDAKVSC